MLSLELLRTAGEGVTVAHGTIAQGTVWWQAWSVDPPFLVPMGLLAWWYGAGLRRWPLRTREHPWWRTALFYSGIGIFTLATESPLDRLATHAFSMHMIQHELIMMWAVPLVLLGAPTTPVLRGMPRWLRRGVVRPVARQPWMRWLYRWGTHPAVVVGVLSAVLWAWHLAPGWYDHALADQKLHDVQHLSFSGAALLFWWNVIDPKPLHSHIPHLGRVLYIFIGLVPKHFLAAMIVFDPRLLYDSYRNVRPILPLTPLEDQQLAGLIMWVPSVMMMLITMAIMFFTWVTIAERRQRARDAREETARAASWTPTT